MLQPRGMYRNPPPIIGGFLRQLIVLFVVFMLADGFENIDSSARRRRQDNNDVTTVLLVDSHGRSSFGRYLNVKPDLGLITSTARTFIQEGVTTEYATQVLGTTLDNGRLYAHLLTKSSRVLYDGEPASKMHDSSIGTTKKWHNPSKINYIQPNHVQPMLIFPTTRPEDYPEAKPIRQELNEEEILKEEPSNNVRVPFDEAAPLQSNVKIFQINPHAKDLTHENLILKDEQPPKLAPLPLSLSPEKVKGWENLPTFTVRNEFSPSGFSYLGDFPEYDSNTERNKPTTVTDRKAKLLFRAGFVKPELRDLQTTTYSGFADFTTTVGDTVIVFTPHTSEVAPAKAVTKIAVEPTIRPTASIRAPTIGSTIKTFLSHDPPMETTTVEGHKIEMKTTLPTMIIDKSDRQRRPKQQDLQQSEDMDAKSAVLAHEQQSESTISGKSTIIFGPELIQPSESQISMLSTPSDEDIAKIFASLRAKATEPLNTPSTIFLEESSTISTPTAQVSSGATTIFFEDDLPIENTAVVEKPQVSDAVPDVATTESTTTTEKEQTTTVKDDPTTNLIETTTSDESTTTSEETTQENVSNEVDTPKPIDVVCTEGSQLVPTTVYKTLTYLTTFFIPKESTTTTSIKSNEVVSTEIGFETKPCNLNPTSVIEDSTKATILTTTEQEGTTTHEIPIITTNEVPTTESSTEELTTTESEAETTPALEVTPQEITTERRHVTESEPETTETTTESGEEIELIFKTLYTTYTYLTTYFQDTTSSIASKIVVTTNVITSTLVPGSEASDSAVAGLFEDNQIYKSRTVTFDDIEEEIVPTKISDNLRPTLRYEADEDNEEVRATPILNDAKVAHNAVKTYYTTYTYFTTIFVDGETEISSRTEVYTNFVTPSATATSQIVPTKLVEIEDDDEIESDDNDDEDALLRKKVLSLNVSPTKAYNSTISRQRTTVPNDKYSGKLDNNILTTGVAKEQAYVTLQRGTTTEEVPLDNALTDYETIATMVTDVRSSTSDGDRRIIDNVDKRNVLDDQIVSESNNESEIIPSPTLLLQTSYTTFTYFTTMYHGTTSSNIVSRLETVTNVVTETLTPTHTLSVEDLSLPITYFTTFTYWTTLYKDGTTKVTSREDTISNVVTPTPSASPQTISITPTASQVESSTISTFTPAGTESVQPSTVGDDDLTTYFTTYTYYTTSYVGDSTVLNSRLETITNVLNSTASTEIGTNTVSTVTPEKSVDSIKSSSIPQPIGLLSTIVSTETNSGTATVLSTDVYGTFINGIYAKVLESTSSIVTETITPTSVSSENLKPTGVVSINHGKVVDADGISTLFFTTQAVGTYIDSKYAQVIESTSSLSINEERKAALATESPITHRTGLVRVIDGSIIQNQTTTLYQSKVLGTIIDGRYAQIIESTSSFLVGKASISPSTSSEISPTSTKAPDQNISPTTVPILPSPVDIEGSLSDSSTIESTTKEQEEGGTRSKSRLKFPASKRPFTPTAIRPFKTGGKPSSLIFSPKRKNISKNAATILRNDVTPTVTAVPASKSIRFGAGRRTSSNNNIAPTATGSRRFSRPKTTSSSASTGFGGGRRSSSRIQPTATGFGGGSSRRSGFRTSGVGSSQRASSLFNGGANTRFRIRPTASLRFPGASTTPSNDEENDLTTLVTDNPTDSGEDGLDTTAALSTTTEGGLRRGQNPLLKLRRPPLTRASTPRPVARTTKSKTKTTTAATTPKPRATFARPGTNRLRTNSLFPRRNLFTTTSTTTTSAPEEEDDELIDDDEEENGEDDTDYEGSQRNTQTEPAPTLSTRRGRANSFQVKPIVGFRRRTRREVNYSRFRRPNSRTTSTTEAPEPENEAPRRPNSRYSPRSRTKTTHGTTQAPVTSRKRIAPTKPSSQRSQFTLREKDGGARSSYNRRGGTSRPSQAVSRPKSPRLRTTSPPEAKRTSHSRGRGTSRRPSSSTRGRVDNVNDNFILPQFDGTITVTHQIPTEVTIPVVNGKVTEYKNVITAKISTEILGPKQYSTSVNALGKDVTVLVSEATSIGDNGATQITHFVLNETPTTSVIFTPTYIRGRKTSFSHVIPSTAYGVDQVINTIQPALAAQAPLANILLSQLLLGGGLQQQNPLLALQNQGQAATPTTEYKTRATTYVTTVTAETSTVIPLTFRGKEILTTIIDSSVSVVTATEFLTDTIVVTPTLAFPGSAPQFNTLLLPLLQQQLAQQQQLQAQLPAGVLAVTSGPIAQALYQEPADVLVEEEELDAEQLIDEVTPAPRRKNARKKNKKATPVPTEPPKETSVITLYVSGRTPGEFSTVLSTVIVGENDRRRREVIPSNRYEDLLVSTADYFDTYVMPASKDVHEMGESQQATESLESILGDVNKYITSEIGTKPTKASSLASKKYKINLVTFDEVAPLMPKVETSLWGANRTKFLNYVSKIHNGKIIRFKRDTISNNINNNNNQTQKPKRQRVVKKLVRVEPISQQVPEVTTRRNRRRIRVKKKKRKLKSIIEPTPKRRRVVTKKRLLAQSIIQPTEIIDTTTEASVTTTEENVITTTEEETDDYYSSEEPVFQHVPDYEPSFHELLSEPLAPILLLKTTILTNIEQSTQTMVTTRLRTYTFVVTRINGAESVITSTTEVRPQTKTILQTELVTKLTTLTLLDLDPTSSTLLNPIKPTLIPASSSQLKHTNQVGRAFEEARYNLATRIMSNGVEVIVAGDKSTLPGEPDVKRVLPSTIYKPITLKPSTLSHQMMMSLPQDGNVKDLASLYPNQFVTKTCLTTFTYLTTYLESGTTAISSHEQVVSNIATEERNTGKILPTPAMGITLTQYPNLSVGVFHTTYTYLNTIIDGEQPLVVTSKHTVTNTVTAPDDYLSMLQPSEEVSTLKNTNTYFSTVKLEKTIYEGDETQVVSTNEVVTQVVITESVPPKATSVMTSYIAFDSEDSSPLATTDVTKTYFVTYTYYNTLNEDGKKVVKTNVSTSSDIVTEKLFLRASSLSKDEKKKQKSEDFKIFATKTYHTTFTYFTTLLQEGDSRNPTVVSSHSKVIENVVTETIPASLLEKKYLKQLRGSIKDGSDTLTHLATLNNGDKMEITIIANRITPTKVLPIEKTAMPASTQPNEIEPSTPSVIIGSTIIFLDEETTIQTPTLTEVKSSTKVVKKTVTGTTKIRRNTKVKSKTSTIQSTKSEPKKPASKVAQVSDLLGLGSINMNHLQALTPVLNAMAGLIKTNLKSNRRNDTIGTTTTTSKPEEPDQEGEGSELRSPIYIPVRGLDDIEVAESQNIATFHLQETEWDQKSSLLGAGIPISPGEVISTNSDIIVGKHGRIGPRIPSIPINQVRDDDGYGMKPPPPLAKIPKRSHEYKHIPVSGPAKPQVVHAPSKDDYIGPPPPPEQSYAPSEVNYGVPAAHGVKELKHYDIKSAPIKEDNYEQASRNTIPIYAEHHHPIINNPILNNPINFQPSIVLPEIIERSTGQPLLVNIQPSQVAFVNIPHNRTTALIYGGSTEPHRNGQYFDDPSPYPEPEFSGIEINNGMPQLASVYHNNQQQVGGVIKVAPQPIKFEQSLQIQPTRPNFNNFQQEVSMGVPPISFGMVQKDNTFTGHVIKHDNVASGNVFVEEVQHPKGDETIDLRPPNLTVLDDTIDLKPPQSNTQRIVPPSDNYISNNAKKQSTPPKRRENYINRGQRPEISEFMTPPPFTSSKQTTNKQHFNRPPVKSRPQQPVPIPLTPEQPPNDSNYSIDDSDEDLTSEDGEVIEESNQRPLLPGQVPFEILKIQASTISPRRNETVIRFPASNSYNEDYRPRPIVSDPRPFNIGPLVRPENQQTNQINNFDLEHDQYNYITPKPDPGFITYISSVTNAPEIRRTSSKRPYVRTTVFRRRTTTTARPTTTRRPATVPALNRSSYGVKSRPNVYAPVPIPVPTTRKPNRPRVTSLPIDHHQAVTPERKVLFGSQTETPFRTPKPVSIIDLLRKERVTTSTQPPKSTISSIVLPTIEESQLEIMKPPLPTLQTKMQPPKIEIISPGSILKVPPSNIESHNDLEAQANTPIPYIPKPSQDIKPPPPDPVLGMSPPPLETTRSSTTTKRTPITYHTEGTTENSGHYTRPSRRPGTRRSTTRASTTTPSTTTTRRSTRRPIRPNYEIYERNRTTISRDRFEITTRTSKLPTSTSPRLEVIIGNPTLSPPIKEDPINNDTFENVYYKQSSTEKSIDLVSSGTIDEVSTDSPILTTPVHHAGNEIRIIDDDSSTILSSSTPTRTLPTLIRKDGTPVLPTRYITHTKTSTVTITKTTVVKTLGGPPSTLTLLVTKTEKSTIVDTVTEFHTLVQPTSIIETVTTTINTGSSLYPPEVYGSSYPAIKIAPTTTSTHPVLVIPTVIVESTNSDEEDLNDFIISETDPPIKAEEKQPIENESILVVMTDKNKGSVIKVPSHETQNRDEELDSNEANNVLLSGIFLSNQPTVEIPRSDKCEPECKASRNELCQKVDGVMRCVCRPGFARMFPDRPCIPTYTYSLQVNLRKIGREKLIYSPELSNQNSSEFIKLTRRTHEALDRMVMQSDLRDIYHGIHVHGYAPTKDAITTKFYLQLSDNTDESRLEEVFKKYLRSTNYSLGGTEMFAESESINSLRAVDFDECTNHKYHDCSENAHCFNLKGTYTCSCKEGFSDLSENILYPGRVCSAELIGCEKCSFHGTCYARGDEQPLCECFHWYTGDNCQINLKVLLIALVTLGTILLALLLICIALTCCRKKPRNQRMSTGISFLPQRVNNGGTIDRRAMIQDTSSEDSRSETNNTLPYVAQKKKLKGALKKPVDPSVGGSTINTLSFPDQKDRSLTVMIPRAKYHPAPPTSSALANYTSFDARKPSVPPSNNNEAKLLSYLDAGPSPAKEKQINKRKYSANSDSYIEDVKPSSSRKTSGALVSAGFEVSATVLGNNMGTMATTCGTEADRSENATLIQKISADLLSSTGTRSQFNTIRGDGIDPMENWLDMTPRINTVSEARSYDETTIPPPMKSFRGEYDSKPSSQHHNDEANTMAERDLGSTFLLPHTHLYKPDRGSDISGFESL